MSLSLNEFTERIKLAKENLPQEILRAYISTAQDANSIIQTRIIETGKNEQGVALSQIKPYTDQYLKYKQQYVQGGQNKAKQKKKGKKDKAGNLIMGRYRGFVDLSLSAQMWASIKVNIDQARIDKKGVRVFVGADDDFNKKILEYNVDLRGDVLNLSVDELDILADNLSETLAENFNSYFL